MVRLQAISLAYNWERFGRREPQSSFVFLFFFTYDRLDSLSMVVMLALDSPDSVPVNAAKFVPSFDWVSESNWVGEGSSRGPLM